jgi:hypothetical protein
MLGASSTSRHYSPARWFSRGSAGTALDEGPAVRVDVLPAQEGEPLRERHARLLVVDE